METEILMDKQTKWANKPTELHQFQKESSYDGESMSLSSLNSIGQSVFELESRN